MDKRTVLVTGGTQGIGKAIVMRFAALGFNVATCGRDKQLLAELKSELSNLGVDSLVQSCDLRDKKAIRSFFDQTIATFNGVDVVVNNAGVFYPGTITDEEDDLFDIMMETNLNATYYFSKAAIPYLKKSTKGAIISTASK